MGVPQFSLHTVQLILRRLRFDRQALLDMHKSHITHTHVVTRIVERAATW